MRAIDCVVRRASGVRNLSPEPDCIFRVRLIFARQPILLPDRLVASGEMTLEIHLWNDRLPVLPAGGADLAWSVHAARRWKRSLGMLSRYLHQDPRGKLVQAIGATTALGGSDGSPLDLLLRLGFTTVPGQDRQRRFAAWWESAYAWALMWTFNPASLRGKRKQDLRMTRYWISRHGFLSQVSLPRC